jgi:competence protein ComEC
MDTLRDAAAAVQQRPLLALTAALVLGVVLADGAPLPWWCALASGLICAGMTALHPDRRVRSAAALAGAAALGALLHLATLTLSSNDVSQLSGTQVASASGHLLKVVYSGSARNVWLCEARCVTGYDGTTRAVTGRFQAVLEAGDPQRGRHREPPRPGGAVALYGCNIGPVPGPTNWCQRDRRRPLARDRVFCQIAAQDAQVIAGGGGFRTRANGWLWAARDRLTERLRASAPSFASAADRELLVAMVLGDAAARMDEDTRELFRRTGTVHLLVVSGAQVSMVAGLVLLLMGRRQHPRLVSGLAVVALVVGFGLVTGMGPSIARSVVMCLVWVLSTSRGRTYDVASSIALAALGLVVSRTATVFDVGAQLTFAGTLGVWALAPLPRHIEPWGRSRVQVWALRLREASRVALWCTLGVWLFISPLLMHRFYSVPVLGAAANLLAIPLSGVVVAAGLADSLVSLIHPALGWVPCLLAWLGLKAIVGVNLVCERLPLCTVDRVYLGPIGCVIWYVVLGGLIWAARRGALQRAWTENRGKVVTVGLVALAAVVVLWGGRELLPRPFQIVTFDVGEGQATLLETPGRGAILVDAGGRSGQSNAAIAREILLPYLIRHGHRRLDAVIISHADSDHYGAAWQLLPRMPVNVVLVNGTGGEGGWHRFLSDAQRSGAQVRVAGQGTRVSLGGARLDVLAPPPEGTGGFPHTDNNRSLVVLAEARGLRALLPGDLERAGMRWLLEELPAGSLRAAFLQVPHHGRASANLPAFWEAVKPQVAVVSMMGEPVERPGADDCARVAARVYRTDQSGAVRVTAARGSLIVETHGR